MVLNQALAETLRHFFAGQPVSQAYLFGSVARGNATEQSDLDVLVELDKGATLFDHARMSWQLEDLLQHRVANCYLTIQFVNRSLAANTFRQYD